MKLSLERHDIVFTGYIVGGTAPILVEFFLGDEKDDSNLENSWATD